MGHFPPSAQGAPGSEGTTAFPQNSCQARLASQRPSRQGMWAYGGGLRCCSREAGEIRQTAKGEDSGGTLSDTRGRKCAPTWTRSLRGAALRHLLTSQASACLHRVTVLVLPPGLNGAPAVALVVPGHFPTLQLPLQVGERRMVWAGSLWSRERDGADPRLGSSGPGLCAVPWNSTMSLSSLQSLSYLKCRCPWES